ncbi:hypothetical protein OY671_013143, partial [Metschnikowia pulcherrima]
MIRVEHFRRRFGANQGEIGACRIVDHNEPSRNGDSRIHTEQPDFAGVMERQNMIRVLEQHSRFALGSLGQRDIRAGADVTGRRSRVHIRIFEQAHRELEFEYPSHRCIDALLG